MNFWNGGKNMRDSFIFYRSFYEAIKDLPRDIQGEIYTAIMEYSLYGNETDNLKPIARSIFTLIKPQIDVNNKRFDNGNRGGRPKKNNQNETKDKPTNNQNETKDKPNNNDNKNNNENVNEEYIPPYNPPVGGGVNLEEFTKKQKELEAKEAGLRAKEQELLKLEAALNARKRAELPNIDFVSPEYAETFTTWLEYKRERRESYKSDKSLRAAYSKLLQLSENDPQKATAIIEQSMANNWAGLFELKTERNGNQNRNHYSSKQEANDYALHALQERMEQRRSGFQEELPKPF